LAAAIDLHAQVKQAHWNVRGPGFFSIHELFDDVTTVIEEYSDMLAERAGALGGAAQGTVQVAAEQSFLIPYPLRIADCNEHVFAASSAWPPSANPRARRSVWPRTTATRIRPIS
jgi:starvation-inducible DNA-binding protein